MKGEQDKNSVIAPGTAQRDRYLWALNPENIRVDARELHAFLSFCLRAARLVQNVNARNEPEGTWADALEKNPAVFLALLLDNNPEKWDIEFREIIQNFYIKTGDGKNEACESLIGKLLDAARLLDGWYKNSIALLKWGIESPVTPVLTKAIESDLSHDIQRLKELWTKLAQENQVELNVAWRKQYNDLDPIWKQELPGEMVSAQNIEPKKNKRLMTSVEEMLQMVQHFQFSMNYISQKAQEWFENTLEHKHDHDPSVGLLLSFLQLFLHARDQINTLPQRHLHHYYFDLLQQKLKPQVPDEAVVSFQLTDSTKQFFLPKNTLLRAGVNEAGKESHYATKEDVWLNSARIASLRTTMVARSDMMEVNSSYKLVSSVFCAPVANSRDGLGASFNSGNNEWPPFGEEQLDKNPTDRQMVDANLGFIIAAPILSLKEGTREIDLKFRFSETSMAMLIDLIDDIAQHESLLSNEIIPKLFSNALLIYASGEKGWFPVKDWKTDKAENWIKKSTLTIQLKLSGEEASIQDNNPEVLGESFDTPWPLLKILLNPDHSAFLYSFVAPLELETLEIETRVLGLKSLTLINDIGLLDNSAPFMPFGSVPNRNSYLMIGSLELFRKRLTDLKINIKWNNLPELEGGFSEYYREYNPSINNDTFKVQLSALSNYGFRPMESDKREAFPLFSAASPTGKLHAHSTIKDIQLNYLQLIPDYHTSALPEYTNNLRSGYLKLQLSGTPMAFGHADYPRLFGKAMIEQTRSIPGLFGLGGEKPQEVPLPREPFAPVIEKLTLDYTATAYINLKSLGFDEDDINAGEKIIALYPFGKRVIYSEGRAHDRFLIARFSNDGYLYIGLSDVQPGLPVHILFNILESKRPIRNDFLKVTWSHLRSNWWEPFSEEGLISDTTRQFTTSGIVSLGIPSEIDTDNTIMPAGLFWLRAAAKGNLDIIGRVRDVQINAVAVRWVDNGDDSHFNPLNPLPKIKDLVTPKPEIVSLNQVLDFHGAQPAESLSRFYVRVSERLRHKNRAITTWDVEHIVLEVFPKIRRVKCIGWMEYNKIPPGHIKVIVIPQRSQEDRAPKLGFFELEEICNFLKEKTSSFVNIQVLNPVFEKLKVTCNVLLVKGLEHEKGKYLQLLHEELRNFICPWLNGANIVLGGDISKNDLLRFIKSRPYIRFVTRFSLVQIFERVEDDLLIIDTAGKTTKSEIITASTPWSILVPVDQHNIQFLNSEVNISSAETAIEDMRLETDFIVLDGAISDQSETGVKTHEKIESDDTDFYLYPTTD